MDTDRIIKDNSTKTETLIKIAQALNVSISTFYDEETIASEAETNYPNKAFYELQKENTFLKQQLKEKSEYLFTVYHVP
jgi:hypothetical protein